MKLRVPNYYNKFVCIADKCKDNCCIGGWEINIDEETAKYYQTVPGQMGEKLKQSIGYTDEYCFKLKDGKCPFLDSNNLCEIYQKLGEDKMGVVCTQFPRFSEYYGDVKETGLGLACEEAARIILSDDNIFSVVESEIKEEEYDSEEYDSELASYLFEVRNYLMILWDKEGLDLYEKMFRMLVISEHIQQLINDNDYDQIKQFVGEHFVGNININLDENFSKVMSEVSQFELHNKINSDLINNDKANEWEETVTTVWYSYGELESLNGVWERLSIEIQDFLHPKDGESKYKVYKEQFDKISGKFNRKYCNLFKYYIYRYFMKASYDHNVIGKCQLFIANFIIIYDMQIYKYAKSGNSIEVYQKKNETENMSEAEKDFEDIIHIFSRQVEYCEDNIENLYEDFLFDDIYQSENLSKLLK